MDTGLVIKRQYVRRHLMMMVVEQLFNDYRQQGYEVKTQYPVAANMRADLFAVKGEEKIVIELVDGDLPSEAKERLEQTVSAEGFSLRIIDITKVTMER